MLARRIAALAALSVAALAPCLRAQDTTAHPGGWLVGAGLNVASGASAFPSLQLGHEWRAPTSRFGLRLDAGYTGSRPRTYLMYGTSDGQFTSLGSSTESYRDVSLGLLTTFALTRGRMQPYLISGFLLERRDSREELVDFTNPSGLPGAGSLGFQPGTYRRSQTMLGAEAGLGVQGRIGNAWLFAESKTHLPTEYADWRRVHVLTFGLRF